MHPVMVQLHDRLGSADFRVGSCTVNGHRENQEDAHAMVCRDDGGFFGVFDGHGGTECSKHVAAEFAKAISTGPPLREYTPETLATLALAIDKNFIDPPNKVPYDGYQGWIPTSGSTGTFFVARRVLVPASAISKATPPAATAAADPQEETPATTKDDETPPTAPVPQFAAADPDVDPS